MMSQSGAMATSPGFYAKFIQFFGNFERAFVLQEKAIKEVCFQDFWGRK